MPLSMISIFIVIQKEVAGSGRGGCTYGTATAHTFGGVRSRPTTEEEEANQQLNVAKFRF